MDETPGSPNQQIINPRPTLYIVIGWVVVTAALLFADAHVWLREVLLRDLGAPSGEISAAALLAAGVLVIEMIGHGLWSVAWRRAMGESLRRARIADANQRERYHGLLNSIDAGTIICRPHTDGGSFTVADLNTAAEMLSGVKRYEALGACPTTLLPRQHTQAVHEMTLRVWRTGIPVTVGALPYMQDNRQHWHTYHAFRMPAGEVVLSFEDVTAQRDAENERQLLSAVVQQMQEALIVMDHRGNIIYVNQAFEALYGYDRDEVLGQPGPEQLIDPRDEDSHIRIAMANNLAKGIAWSGEYPVRHENGKTVWVHGTHCPIQVNTETPPFWFSIVHDVTERREIEQRFRQVTKMEAVGQLAGGIAHDFNNLLTVINGYSQMALMTLGEDDPSHDDFSAIAQAGERAASLVQQLLAFSRRQVMRMESVDLNDHIQGMDRILSSLVPESIDLTLDLQDEIEAIEADPTQVEQVIINLVANACDAMPGGGDLVIRTQRFAMTDSFCDEHDGAQIGAYVLLEVADTGTGIAPDILDHIFEPFYTTKAMGHGTGLGLSTVYGIVKQSQGYVYVDTEMDKGTTFSVFWPLAGQGDDENEDAVLRGPISGGTETLLIAEDEAIVRYVTARFMMRLGYDVLTASSGREALALYESHPSPIHMLIADVVMPEMNGDDLARQLVERQPDLAVLLVTGYSDHVIETRADISSQAQVLRKPYDQHDLAKVVREALDARVAFEPDLR